MKNRLNITIDSALVDQAKRYAEKHQISLSQLVEHYFKSLTRATHKKNILELLDKLPQPRGRKPSDALKDKYYEGRKKKYGF